MRSKDWFATGERLPYDSIAKCVTHSAEAEGPNTLFIYNKHITYKDQRPGTAISFLPGFPTGSYDWAKIDALIAHQRPLNRLYVDYVGQGESDKPEIYPYSLFERADLVEALWEHHRIESTMIVTYDYSSLVAMELLRRRLEKVAKGIRPATEMTAVVFINGGYFADGHSHPIFTTPLLKTKLGKRGAIRAQTLDFAFDRMLKALWSKKYPFTATDLAEVRDAVRRRNGALFLHLAAGFVDEHKAHRERLDLRSIVEKMHKDVRFYIIGSEEDKFEPRQVKLAKERLGKYGVSIEVLPGGHMITMEQPQLLADRIVAVADQVI